MPASKDNKKKKSEAKQPPSFEQALDELEEMVETMESGQLPLEKLIANYERGAWLISHCETVLDSARKRLDLITLKPKASTEDASNDPTKDGAPAPNNDDDDEIRLF